MRETAVESPLSQSAGKGWGTREPWIDGLSPVESEEAGRGRPALHRLGLEAEASAQRENTGS